jgi:nucleoside-diphosphate-sugar epimerase
VTGGAGFIGSHLVDRLLAEGFSVRVLDDLSTGLRSNLPVDEDLRFVEGSILDDGLLEEVFSDADYVVHLAALGSVPRSIADPLSSHEVNATGTLRALIAARDCGVRRFVFASSSSVYGDHPGLPKREPHTGSLLSPYAASKQDGENYSALFRQLYDMDTVSLRFFNVFGPRQRADHPYAAVTPRFMSAAAQGEPLVIYGDGEQTRDFTYVDNTVGAVLAALLADPANISGEVFNVACGGQTSLLEVISALQEITQLDLDVVHKPARQGDVRHSHADVKAFYAATGFEAKIDLRAGLTETWAWHAGRP